MIVEPIQNRGISDVVVMTEEPIDTGTIVVRVGNRMPVGETMRTAPSKDNLIKNTLRTQETIIGQPLDKKITEKTDKVIEIIKDMMEENTTKIGSLTAIKD